MNIYKLFENTFSPKPLPISKIAIAESYLNSDNFHRPMAHNFWKFEEQSKKIIFTGIDTWIHYVQILTDNRRVDINLYYTPQNGEAKKMTLLERKDVQAQNSNLELLTYQCSDFVKSVAIENASNSSIRVSAIKIMGVELNDLSEIIREGYKNWEEYKEENEKFTIELNSKLNNLKLEVESEQKNIENLKNVRSGLQNQHDSILEAINLAKEQQLTVQSFLDTAQERLSKSNLEEKRLLTELSEKKTELSSVTKSSKKKQEEVDKLLEDLKKVRHDVEEFESKKRTYSEDFSTFKDGVSLDNYIYIVISIILLFVGGEFILQIKSDADQLITSFDSGRVENIWALFVSRLPSISVNVICVSFVIATLSFLINLIVANNKQINKVKQISYLVKEIAEVQAEGLNLTNQEIYEKRIKNKLELVRESLSSEMYSERKNRRKIVSLSSITRNSESTGSESA
ncbi:hypothetical protein WOC18_19760 [Vibrio parahaemolyticus]